MAFGRIQRIYEPGHTRVAESVVELKSIADEMLGGRSGAVEVVFHDSGLRVDGRTVHEEPAVVESFAEVMRARGVRALAVRGGIRPEELILLSDVLARPARDIVTDGGLAAILAGLEHPHFDLAAAGTTFGGEAADGAPDGAGAAPASGARELEELLGEPGALPPEPVEEHRLVYTACGKEELGTRSSNLLAVAEETLRAEAARHDPGRTASMALCDMVGRSGDELEYRRRRDLLCAIVREKRLDARAMRIALLHLRSEDAEWPHEDPDALLLELGALAADPQLLESALSRTELSKADARRIADNLASRPDAFDLLASLLRAPLPEHVLMPVRDVFVETVREEQTAFRRWALEHPGRLLCKPVFSLLLGRIDFALGPVVKDFFASPDSKGRDRLVEALVAEGSESALRLLVLGTRHTGELRDPRLILSFGKFKHELAVGVLREVVHRCNSERYDVEEASSAIRALAEIGIEDAIEFLESILSERRFLVPAYRRPLRDLAQDALEVA